MEDLIMDDTLPVFLNGSSLQFLARLMLAYLAIASPELGTAQPQLVLLHF